MTQATSAKRASRTLVLAMAALLSVGPAGPRADAADEKAKAPAAKPPTTKPETPKGSFDVMEWVVLVVDPNRPNANEAAMFKTALPGFARGRRPAADTATGSAEAIKAPSPVGVIRLVSKSTIDEDPIDVLLQVPKGKILSQWPQGKPKPNRQLWDKIVLKAGTIPPVQADAGHWFETLRKATGASPLSTDRWSEGFLAYDVEVSYQSVLKVKAAGQTAEAYEIANAGSSTLRDVEIYSPAEGGWRVAGLKELIGTRPASTTKPAAPDAPAAEGPIVPTGPATEALKQVFAEVSAEVASSPKVDVKIQPATAPAATQPTTAPATQATTKPANDGIAADSWRKLTIAPDAKPLAAAEAVVGWRSKLGDLGLPAGDVDTILATLRGHALDPEQMTIVYRLEPTELDQLLPLEVVPTPMKTTRVGLVILKNIDPAAGERIAKLITQLGDADWNKREAAYKKLAEIGAGARPKLNEALKNSDIEIVYRVERLLDATNAPPTPPQ